MRMLLHLLLLAMVVPPLGAQRVLTLGDTVRLDYRVGSKHFLGFQETHRLKGLLHQLTADSVVLHETAGSRAVARKDVVAVQRLSGRGYDWNKAALPMAVGGALGLVLGVKTVNDDELSGGEAALAITSFTVLGVQPGFTRGLDSRGRTGFTIGALVGAAAGLAVGIATMPEPSPPCNPSSPFCFDLPDVRGIYPIATALIGSSWGGLLGGILGSSKPGERWEKTPLPRTTLGLHRLPQGRAALVVSVGVR
jgi:hypothetical protein